MFRLRDFRFLFEKIHNPAHGDDTVLHLINTVVDLRQKVHNAEDICHARSHNADLELTDENHQSTDRDRGNISDLTDDIEYQTIFGGYVHLLEISVFQIPVDAVEFMLLQLLVREGTDKPYRIDVFLHIQVHIRIAVPDICGNSAGGTGIPYKSKQQYRSNCGRQKEHPRAVCREQNACHRNDKKAVSHHQKNAAIHFLCRDDIGRKRRQKLAGIIGRHGGTVQVDQLFICYVAKFVLHPDAVLLKQHVAQINERLADDFKHGKNGSYTEE